jgi:hypothetical protein
MTTNLLIAIQNIVSVTQHQTQSRTVMGKNRINHVGIALETFIKDAFAGTLYLEDEIIKAERYQAVFSYLGNTNNPPDMMLHGGDAIEVKKIESKNSALALNSSYPKAKLYSDSLMINKACRTCEDWNMKDSLYTVGTVQGTALKTLWFVYGDCYAADKEVYERIKNTISAGIQTIPNIEFDVKTKELGKVHKVDPLGITDLRIRGMWHIAHPNKVYEALLNYPNKTGFKLFCLMRKEKFDSFDDTSKAVIQALVTQDIGFLMRDVKIKNPNNPAQLLDAVFMEYYAHE